MVFDGNFRGLRWSTKGVMNEWRSGRIFSLLFLVFLLPEPLLCILVIYEMPGFLHFHCCYRFLFPRCSLYFPHPLLCTGFLFSFKRLLLRSGRRANGIARERERVKEGTVGRKSNIFSCNLLSG
ncbi:hypothetical protein HDV63DRAFT_382304 [Trichoderma sp. SZMC 28014]